MFVATVRLKGPSSRETFDVWRVLSKDGQVQAAVTLSGKDKSVSFTTTNTLNGQQIISFDRGIEVSKTFTVHYRNKAHRDCTSLEG